MRCSEKDTFYVDPNVEGCECLTARARRLGLKTKGFLGEGVTVCVAATSRARKAEEGGQSRGRRRDRIHRMVTQAQTEPKAGGAVQQLQAASIADRARKLNAVVISGLAFRTWLDGRGAGVARGAGGGTSNKGKVGARPLISLTQRAGTERYKSQEHPRVVIKDLDGLEPDRVQALPPELLRKCHLYEDAPPGICPFTPREQWDREVLKLKKKDTQCGGGKEVAARTSPGPLKPRRGGWCECCEKQYIGTMAEHCGSDQHRTSVAKDLNFAVLLRFLNWTGGSNRESSVPADATAAAAGVQDAPTAARQAADVACSGAVVDDAGTATGKMATVDMGNAHARRNGACEELPVNGDGARRCVDGGVPGGSSMDQQDSVHGAGGIVPPTGEQRAVHDGGDEKPALGVVGDHARLARGGASCNSTDTAAKENVHQAAPYPSSSQGTAHLSREAILRSSRSHKVSGQRKRATRTVEGKQAVVSPPQEPFARPRSGSPVAHRLRHVASAREDVFGSGEAGESCVDGEEDAIAGSGVPVIDAQDAKGLQGPGNVMVSTSPEHAGASLASTTPPQASTATTKHTTRSSPLQACSFPESCGTGQVDGAGSTKTRGVSKTSPPSQGPLPGKKQRHAVRILADSPGFARALGDNGSAAPCSFLSKRDGRHLRSGGGGGDSPQGLRREGGDGTVGASCPIPPASATASASSSPASPEAPEGVGRTDDTAEVVPKPTGGDTQLRCNVDDPGSPTNGSGSSRARNERRHSPGGVTVLGENLIKSCSPPSQSQRKNRQHQRQMEKLADSPDFSMGSSACPSRTRRSNGTGVSTRTTDLCGLSTSSVASTLLDGCARQGAGHSTEAVFCGDRKRVRESDGRRRSVTNPQKREGSTGSVVARSPGSVTVTESDEGGGGGGGGGVGLGDGSPSGKGEQTQTKKRRRGVDILLATAGSPLLGERVGRVAAERPSRRCREGRGNSGDDSRGTEGRRELSARGGPAERAGTTSGNKNPPSPDVSEGNVASRTRRPSPGCDQIEHGQQQPVRGSSAPSPTPVGGDYREKCRRKGGARGCLRTVSGRNQESSAEEGDGGDRGGGGGGSCVGTSEETLPVSLSGSFKQVKISQRFPARPSGPPAVDGGEGGIGRRDSLRSPPQTAAYGTEDRQRLSPSACTRARTGQNHELRPTTLGEIAAEGNNPQPSLSQARRVTDLLAEDGARSRQAKGVNTSSTSTCQSVSSSTEHEPWLRSATSSPPESSHVRQRDAVAAAVENQRSESRKRGYPSSGDDLDLLVGADTRACTAKTGVADGPVRRIKQTTATDDGASRNHDVVGVGVSVPSVPTRARTMTYESCTRSRVSRPDRKD